MTENNWHEQRTISEHEYECNGIEIENCFLNEKKKQNQQKSKFVRHCISPSKQSQSLWINGNKQIPSKSNQWA